jgi:protein-S-isoprenylcysteine O-methyltransferase Ste14
VTSGKTLRQTGIVNDKSRGNLYVAIQFVFLAVLVFAPAGALWPTNGVVGFAGVALEVVGFGVLAVSFINLGKSLTAHPMPLATGALKTSGLYAVVRHPIYLGLLLVATGLTLHGASLWHVVGLVGLSVLLHVKAGFEERLLRAAYPEYEAYARRVGRLIPKLSQFTRGGDGR